MVLPTNHFEMNFRNEIITHPGPAHLDEFLAVCLIFAKEGEMPVFRTTPTPEDLQDMETWVVDVGGVYDPSLRNFDHHQPNGPDMCSLRLVAKEFALDDLFMEVFPWYAVVDLKDRRGPNQVAQLFNITVDSYFALSSPLEKEILDMFTSVSSLSPGEMLSNLMWKIGKNLISVAEGLKSALQQWRQCPRYLAKCLTVIDARNQDKLGSMFGFNLFRKECPEVAIVISKNPRGGISLTRIDDHPLVDFRRLEGSPDVTFIHKNGFLAVVKEGADLEKLVKQAISE